MPAYKLCYFNARGLGEMCRLLFAEAGVEYEDARYAGEEWQKHKPEMLFNQMPVLFVDGEQIAHSRAAFRYLAREFKLDGGSSLNAAKLDMWLEAIFEAMMKLPFSEKDETKKAELAAIAFKDFIHPKLSKFEDIIKSKGGLYAFGDKVSALDILVYACCDMLRKRGGDSVMEQHPVLVKLMKAVEDRPNIKKWLATRPVTEN